MKIFQSLKNALKLSIVGKLTRFFGNYVLSWLLFPEDYGIIAIAMATTEVFSMVNQIGLQAFYIQDNATEKKTLFSTVCGIDFVLTTIMFLGIIASTYFFKNNSKVTVIIILMAVNTGLSGFFNTRFSDFKKELDFKSFANFNIVCDIISTGSKILFAYAGFGAASFIGGEILGNLVKVLVSLPFIWKFFSWRAIDKALIKRISWFGKHSLVTGFATYIVLSFDKIFLYRITDLLFLGYYNFALSQTTLFFAFLISPFNDILFSAYPKHLGNTAMLNQLFSVFHFIVSAVLLPFYVFLIINPSTFLMAIYAPKWELTAWMFALFSIQKLVQAFCFPAMPMLVASGRPDISSKFKLAKAALVIILPISAYFITKNINLTILMYVSANILGDLMQFFYTVKRFKLKIGLVLQNVFIFLFFASSLAYIVPRIMGSLNGLYLIERQANILSILVYALLFSVLYYIFFSKRIKEQIVSLKQI